MPKFLAVAWREEVSVPHLRINTFTKIFSLIVVLLIPIIVLYGYSNGTSVGVVRMEVEKSMYKDLSFFADKLDEIVTQTSKNALLIREDMNVRTLEFIDTVNLYEQTDEKRRVEEKLRLLNSSSPWDTTISVYAPETGAFVSTNPTLEYDSLGMLRSYSRNWLYTTDQSPFFRNEPRFVRVVTDPFDAPADKAGLIVQVSFPAAELVKSLDRFRAGGKGDPFLVSADKRKIASTNANRKLQSELLPKLDLQSLAGQRYARLTLSEGEYAVSSVWMPSLGWYLVDYVPIHEVTEPITATGRLFYVSIGLLLLFSIPAAYYLYTNVQIPIKELIRGVRQLKKGEYPRLRVFHPNNEFHFLLVSFNEMAAQIEELIQNVYLERIHSREANLRQLQSQINPHFLYNCFTLVRSLTRLGQRETVMELALNLSKYYRYTTRTEKHMALLQEELDLIGSYLAIQAINVQDLQYEIEVPEPMLRLELPRLIVQPLVENAVLHGIEPVGSGFVRVHGSMNDRYAVLTVTDNGAGISPAKLAELQQQLLMPLTEEKGCALWNVVQRMQLQFGSDSGLRIVPGDGGGLTVELYWPRSLSSPHVPDRGTGRHAQIKEA